MTTLCLDFGNTRKKVGIFEDAHLEEVIMLENGDADDIRHLVKTFSPDKSILSSVVEHDIAIEKLLSERSRFHKLGHNSKLSISTPVGKPETIGADRLALAAAVVFYFPDQHNLVIGLG